MEQSFFDSDDIRISYLDTGQTERTPVLLIHGFASNLMVNWYTTGWIKTLDQEGYRVIAIDNRGHGQSEKLYGDADYGAPTMAKDAVRLLDHLKIQDAHIMGYSMGARISAFINTQDPDRVKSTVFAGMGYNMVRGIGAPEPIAKGLLQPKVEDIKHDTVRSFRLFAESTKSDLKALAACILSTRKPVQADELAEIKKPVLVAVGTKDVIAGSAKQLAQIIPGAEVLDIPDRDHMKAVSDKLYKAGVLAFWAKIR